MSTTNQRKTNPINLRVLTNPDYSSLKPLMDELSRFKPYTNIESIFIVDDGYLVTIGLDIQTFEVTLKCEVSNHYSKWYSIIEKAIQNIEIRRVEQKILTIGKLPEIETKPEEVVRDLISDDIKETKSEEKEIEKPILKEVEMDEQLKNLLLSVETLGFLPSSDGKSIYAKDDSFIVSIRVDYIKNDFILVCGHAPTRKKWLDLVDATAGDALVYKKPKPVVVEEEPAADAIYYTMGYVNSDNPEIIGGLFACSDGSHGISFVKEGSGEAANVLNALSDAAAKGFKRIELHLHNTFIKECIVTPDAAKTEAAKAFKNAFIDIVKKNDIKIKFVKLNKNLTDACFITAKKEFNKKLIDVLAENGSVTF